MTTIIFDSSALTKLLIRETDSDIAIQLWMACDGPVASQLAYSEVCAALAVAERDHRLTPAELADSLTLWTALWSTVRTIDLTDAITAKSGALAVEHGLRGADAVHLACYFAMGHAGVLFASWDLRQREGATSCGVPLTPALLG